MHPSVFRRGIGIAGFVLFSALPLAAQDSPPGYLQIFREEVKPGRGGSHVITEAGWPRAFAKAKMKNHYIALTAVYGPPEAWFVEGHETMAELEESNKAIESAPGLTAELDKLAQADAANISDARGFLGRFRAELSNPGKVDVAKTRVWEVLIFQVRPGHEADFNEAAKMYKSTVEQAKIDFPWATYEVLAGMPGPVYLVFLPHLTLTEIDPATGVGAQLGKAFTEEAQKKLSSLAEGYTSVEDIVFSVSPQMSYMSDEFVARDPKFWTRKPPAAKKQTASAPQ
jgi:hypothetical protein